MFFSNSVAQNVNIEITDYSKKMEGVEFSTYQYGNASYSYSRPILIFVTDKDNFIEIHQKIPSFFYTKQEYTDIFILGINRFRKENITDIDKKIINEFLENIKKFREYYNLPNYSKDEMLNQLNYIEKKDAICKYLSCRNKKLKQLR